MTATTEATPRPHSADVARLMFDYDSLSDAEIEAAIRTLPRKLVRWIAIHHPDNRIRLRFFRATGVTIGEATVINANLMLYDDYDGLVTFGARVAVAADVTIIASSNPNNSQLASHPYVQQYLLSTAPVTIGDDAWLGARCVILPGVAIGAHSIVAAGAVVDRDVAPGTIVAGVPARVVRTLT